MRDVSFKPITLEIHLFKELEQKENFLMVLGAVVMRLISLRKAAEIMEIEPDMFLIIESHHLDVKEVKF